MAWESVTGVTDCPDCGRADWDSCVTNQGNTHHRHKLYNGITFTIAHEVEDTIPSILK